MILKTPNCPVCGFCASAILESVIISTPLIHCADGTTLYGDAESKIHWDTVENIRGPLGVMLVCSNGHEWPSHTEETQA